MKNKNSTFLDQPLKAQVSTLLHDYLSFILFLLFVFICLFIGRLLYFIDRKLRTRLVERLIHFFEFFAR